jgi:hypothetical protein
MDKRLNIERKYGYENDTDLWDDSIAVLTMKNLLCIIIPLPLFVVGDPRSYPQGPGQSHSRPHVPVGWRICADNPISYLKFPGTVDQSESSFYKMWSDTSDRPPTPPPSWSTHGHFIGSHAIECRWRHSNKALFSQGTHEREKRIGNKVDRCNNSQ